MNIDRRRLKFVVEKRIKRIPDEEFGRVRDYLPSRGPPGR